MKRKRGKHKCFSVAGDIHNIFDSHDTFVSIERELQNDNEFKFFMYVLRMATDNWQPSITIFIIMIKVLGSW